MKKIIQYAATGNSIFLALSLVMLYAVMTAPYPAIFVISLAGLAFFAKLAYSEFKIDTAAGSDFRSFEETVKNFDINSIMPEDFGTLDSIDADKAAGRTMIEENVQKTETIQEAEAAPIFADMKRKDIIKYGTRVIIILMVMILSFTWLTGISNNSRPLTTNTSTNYSSIDAEVDD